MTDPQDERFLERLERLIELVATGGAKIAETFVSVAHPTHSDRTEVVLMIATPSVAAQLKEVGEDVRSRGKVRR